MNISHQWLHRFILVLVCLGLILTGSFVASDRLMQPVQAAESYYVLEENFEGAAFPPTGWEVIDSAGSGAVWQSSAERGVPNYCEYGSGYAAVAHPGETNGIAWDTELRSPPIDLTGASTAWLEYASHFEDYVGNGEIWLDVSTDGGTSWVNLRNQTIDDDGGSPPAVGGTLESENLDLFLGNMVVLRWRFHAAASPAWMWHIDTVSVEAVAGYPINAITTIPIQEGFEGTFPPEGWEVIDNAGSVAVWQRNDERGVDNLCYYGSGYAVVAHPGQSNSIFWDTELRSPPLDLTGASTAQLEYASHFEDYAGNGEIWLDVSTDNGATWTNLRYQTEDDDGESPTAGGTLEVEDLTPFLDEVIVLRWRFKATNSAAWMWHIDEVSVKVIFYAPQLGNSYMIAPRMLSSGDTGSYSYIVAIKESTTVPDFEWSWDITLVDDVSPRIAYVPDSLWCSDGNCQQYGTSVYWGGYMVNNLGTYLVFSVDVPASMCGLITNTAVISHALLAESVEIGAVTGVWDDVWMDETMALFPPGWSVSNYAGSLQPGSVFTTTDPGRRGNQTGGRGDFIIVDDLAAGAGITVETDLRLPPLNIPACSDTVLVFKTAFDNQGGGGSADVQISTDGGATWGVLRHWNVDVPGPHVERIDLTPYAGTMGALVRFYYDDGGTDAGWWQIDDVQVAGCGRHGHPPVADGDTFTVTEDSPPVALDVLSGDTDYDCQPLTIVNIGAPGCGGSAINGSTVITYTPVANFYGSEVFTYTVSDSEGDTDTATVTVTVESVNDRPVAHSDVYSLNENRTLMVAAPGLLENDTDVEDNPLVAILDDVPVFGTLALSQDGAFTYTPTIEYNGVVTFTYHADDGEAGNMTTVTITVREVNQAPALIPIGNQTVNETTDLTFTASATDDDVPVQPLRYSLRDAPTGATIDSANGDFIWTPTEAQGPGTYSLTIVVSDTVVTDSETITITVNEVNQAPVLTPIGDQTVDETTGLTFTATASDSDVPTQALTFTLHAGSTGSITSGGDYTWTPTEADGPGTYTATVCVSDGALEDSETFTITATFSQTPPPTYTLNVHPTGSGSVDIDPDQTSYLYGNVVTLTATADPGWTFAGWSVGLGSAAETIITITGDTIITATFIQDAYTLAVQIVGRGSVMVTPDHTTYHYDEVVTLTATAAPGGYFGQWSGGASGTLTQTTVTMTSNQVVTATFLAKPPTTYTLTLGIVGSGVITPDVGAHSYLSGTVVDLSASPATGWQFAGWSGDFTSSANLAQVTMDAEQAITATFSELAPPPTYTLTVDTVGNGTVTVDPQQGSYLAGTVVTLTATPDAGWYFGQWSGDASGALRQIMVTMTSDKVVTATFVAAPPITYTLTLQLVGSGVIMPDVGTHSYLSGTVVDLSASPPTGWQFVGWSGDLDSPANPAQVTLDAHKSITATFALSATENTAPTISLIAAQSTFIGVPVGPLAFTIGDAETHPADLTLAGASSDLALVPTANIVFSGSGADRTVTITPTVGLRGTATITITVSDGQLDANRSFVFTVIPYQIYLPLVQRE